MTIKTGSASVAGEVMTSIGNITARLVLAGSLSDTESFTFRKYTSDSASSATAKFETNRYVLNFTDEASGDTTHDPDSYTTPENAFDNNDSTEATKTSGSVEDFTSQLGKTFSSKFIGWVKVKATGDSLSNSNIININLQTFNGSTWSTTTVLATGSGSSDVTFNGDFFLNTTTQGLRVQIVDDTGQSQTHVHRLFTLEYGDFDLSGIVKQDSVLTTNPDSMVIHVVSTTPANTSITVDISDDGGSTYSLTDVALDEYIDTTSLTGSDISLRFNLATTDDTVTPVLTSWSAVITDT